MKIGELAARAGCDAQTVRFYEREGLLDELAREASGYRNYEEHHLTRLNFIRHCRSLDIPLPEVRQLLQFAASPDKSCGQVNDLLDRHIALVGQRVQVFLALQGQLVALRATCDGGGRHACAILESFVSAAEQHARSCHSP
jgi:Cd(II)/Pb(II)-responsive transcriptional regulator